MNRELTEEIPNEQEHQTAEKVSRWYYADLTVSLAAVIGIGAIGLFLIYPFSAKLVFLAPAAANFYRCCGVHVQKEIPCTAAEVPPHCCGVRKRGALFRCGCCRCRSEYIAVRKFSCILRYTAGDIRCNVYRPRGMLPALYT